MLEPTEEDRAFEELGRKLDEQALLRALPVEPGMSPAEAIRRAELLVLHDYQGYSTAEGRRIMAGLLQLLDARQVDAQMRDILKGEEK